MLTIKLLESGQPRRDLDLVVWGEQWSKVELVAMVGGCRRTSVSNVLFLERVSNEEQVIEEGAPLEILKLLPVFDLVVRQIKDLNS
jgi:hypothetical protein